MNITPDGADRTITIRTIGKAWRLRNIATWIEGLVLPDSEDAIKDLRAIADDIEFGELEGE